jgi:hypothetical protein
MGSRFRSLYPHLGECEGQLVPPLAKAVTAANADSRTPPLLGGGGPGSIIPAQTDPENSDPPGIHFRPGPKIIHHCLDHDLSIRTDGQRILGLPLSRAVKRKRRHPSGQEVILELIHFFFRNIETGNHNDYRHRGRVLFSRQPQVVGQRLVGKGNGDRFGRLWQVGHRCPIAFNGMPVGLLHLIEIMDEKEFGKMVFAAGQQA